MFSICLKHQTSTYFPPGAQSRYSNTGYAHLALIVEKASGMSFAAFLKKNIFDPLHMDGTVAFEEGVSTVRNRAYGYTPRTNGFDRTDQSLTSALLGDGGIYSSVDDLSNGTRRYTLPRWSASRRWRRRSHRRFSSMAR